MSALRQCDQNEVTTTRFEVLMFLQDTWKVKTSCTGLRTTDCQQKKKLTTCQWGACRCKTGKLPYGHEKLAKAVQQYSFSLKGPHPLSRGRIYTERQEFHSV